MEDKKLIAEFMGLKVLKGVNKNSGKNYYYYNNSEMQDYEALPDYNSSWDYLIPVVKKINDLCVKNGRELSNNSKIQEHLKDSLNNPNHWKSWSYHYVHLTTDIDLVLMQVIKFINWQKNLNQPY